jgi:hypothetical protein
MHLAQAPATLKTRSGYQVSIPGGADDVLIQLNNVDVLRITLGANMTIKTSGDLNLEATNIKLKAMNSLTLQTANSIEMRAGSNMDLKAGASATIGAGGTLTVDGATVNINHGALEIT